MLEGGFHTAFYISNTQKMADRLDIVIFGATGYTGKYVVKHATHICKEQNVKFGIAGRRKEALQAVVKEFASDIENVPIILADIKDEESLRKMTKQARVLINCCGPYGLYGEPVVKACIATRTHHIDVTAEDEFPAKIELECNQAAQEAGIYVVSACGSICIPSDLGIIFTQQKFDGEINSVEVYMKFWSHSTDKESPVLNHTSWDTMIYNFAARSKLQELHTKLCPTKLPKFTPQLTSKSMPHRSDVSEGWSLPYVGPDHSLALRTQRFLYDKYKERPAQVQIYVTFKSFFDVLITYIALMIILCMCRTEYTRNLLLKYPSLFSYGMASNERVEPGMLKSVCFSMIFKAYGWTEKLAEPTDEHTDRPNKKVITKLSSDFSGYDFSGIVTILSAITILNEADKMPDNGGVFTPGAAFGKTSIIQQISDHNIKFEVISSTVE
ncbi:PREDICTED: saccharopine dehydrogenase-like oxidoreductase [Vollenhovia emeryi]|uniref:saccharopine dehydrogenase-like oxidoreductase n=1 Tax=Vollenhovia emeryi TaxID=411798 RepID=UPI0005F4F1EA|nr:PREDICTED: saccharopine dehydrogenase-like oxidoreductase [Vollenhovia emeryi]